MKNKGFSLLELSIVLVIIGLIAGGIVAGASMIRAAELRSVLTEFSSHQTAVHTFRDKYLGLPGDLKNATAFWGTMSTGTCPDATAGVGTQTCDGNGNGTLDVASAAHTSSEEFNFWKHLSNAELINGTYTGIAGSSPPRSLPGENVPASKLGSSGWYATSASTPHVGGGNFYTIQYGNSFYFGADVAGIGILRSPSLTPEEAWNIDTKSDDGKPAYGNIIAINWNNLCAAADDGTHSSTDFEASYKLSSDAVDCALVFNNAF